MHISEGILSTPVLISGAVITIAGTAAGLKKMSNEQIPQTAILSAVFFVGSLIHVPIGPSSVHLILNGLLGVLLGWAAYPAILVALFLQALLFQYGGFTSLGVNGATMAVPAIVCFLVFKKGVMSRNRSLMLLSSFLCGALSIFLSAILAATALVFTGEAFWGVAKVLVAAHIPIMIIEGLISVFCIQFLKRVKPEILEVIYD